MRSETPRRGEHQDLRGVRRRASSEGVTSGTGGFGRRFIRPDYRLSARPSPDTPWNDPARLEQGRVLWAEHVNRALELARAIARVDHRSLAAQGIGREPQVHLGPAVVELTARGIDTDRGELAREIDAINAALVETLETACAPPPAITLAPGHDLVRRRSRQRGEVLALLKEAVRMMRGRIQIAVGPALSWRWAQIVRTQTVTWWAVPPRA
jgi:hypothetical protein